MSSFERMTFHIIISFTRMSSSSIIHTKWIRWWEWIGGGISVQVQLQGRILSCGGKHPSMYRSGKLEWLRSYVSQRYGRMRVRLF